MSLLLFGLKVFCIAAGALYVALVIFMILGWKKLPKFVPSSTSASISLAVIVPARNEAENILVLLQCLLNQSYPKEFWSLTIVDDSSTDNTANLVTNFLAAHPEIRAQLITLPPTENNTAPKKRAVATGIAQSSGTVIVTTDADCIVPEMWLENIANYFEEHSPAMLCGPVQMHLDSNLFGKLQALEFMSLIGSTGALIGLGAPVMCNGANLAYERTAYSAVQGFDGVDHLSSGDDVFLMLKVKKLRKDAVQFLKGQSSVVLTQPQPTLGGFFSQRKRWASKSKAYRDIQVILVAAVVLLINVAIVACGLAAFVEPNLLLWLAGALLIKCTIDFLFLHLIASFFGRKSLLILLIPEQILYVFYVAFMGLFGWIGGYRWKGRMSK